MLPRMKAKALTPILNISDITAAIVWFETWGWRKLWDWGTPPTFACAGCDECQIFLCLNGQGGRGKVTNTTTFTGDEDDRADQGAWMSVWVDDVDAVHQVCLTASLDITHLPKNMPWNTREMHLRHPDGHVFRVSGPILAGE